MSFTLGVAPERFRDIAPGPTGWVTAVVEAPLLDNEGETVLTGAEAMSDVHNALGVLLETAARATATDPTAFADSAMTVNAAIAGDRD